MSHHIKGHSRQQSTLFPEALDDFVTTENPVRVIDTFVDSLELQVLGFERVQAKATGRPCYHPATMLKLYIYGYLNRIQSSRRLEKETHRNVELMWLLERLQPDFKTIADFRKDNGQGIKNACRTFIELCREMNMFSDVMVAIDGSKFKAVNSKPNNYTPKKVRDHIARIENSIAHYLSLLAEKDKKETSDDDITLMHGKLAWMKNRLAELKEIQVAVNEHPDKQISLTDPDSRLMKTSNMTRQVCYNVQSAVDTKHHLIVSHEVTQTTDRGKLHQVARQVQEVLQTKDITFIADKGYYSREDIKAVLDTGSDVLVPKGDTSGAAKAGIFNRTEFKYNLDKDEYTCPVGNTLPHQRNSVEHGMHLKVYVNHIACRDCNIRSQCTRSKKEPRKMKRWVHENVIDSMHERLKKASHITVTRKQTVEHPFGTIKMWMGATHYLTRRIKNVSTETSLHVLAYNLKRMMRIMGTTGLMEAIRK
ncbi:IS1182 family transposase [Paraglaciecola chathamensis]|uniref:Transposase n=1 Tax=Paraglaciecola chathamensis S18K6 TaxID=1127672 RepID=A0AAV3V778_9ALTE|nr:IS1182 family transposase [Paraglaciecola chathamensis]GAC12596.1 transposase [Paraglaciecola chathamensis S18K6]